MIRRRFLGGENSVRANRQSWHAGVNPLNAPSPPPRRRSIFARIFHRSGRSRSRDRLIDGNFSLGKKIGRMRPTNAIAPLVSDYRSAIVDIRREYAKWRAARTADRRPNALLVPRSAIVDKTAGSTEIPSSSREITARELCQR